MTEPAQGGSGDTVSPPGQTRRIVSWTMYDWANSVFTGLIVTFIYSAFFSRTIAPDPDVGLTLWGRAVAISGVVIALLSPVVGAMADQGGRRRRYLILSTLVCVVFTAALGFVRPSMPNAIVLSLVLFGVANVAFEVGGVFYNSFLPAVAPPGKMGRISGLGWGVGYTAQIFSMFLALFAFMGFGGIGPWLSLPTAEGLNYRAVTWLVAGWFLVFSIPMFLFVKDDEIGQGKVQIGRAIAEIRNTFKAVGQFREMVKFLIARLIYNDGLVTIFALGGIYATGTFDFTLPDVTIWGITISAIAGLGAFLFGFVDDRLGGKKTILISVAGLALGGVIGVFAPNRTWFWVASILIGIFAGPNQAASRSLMARFVPDHRQAEFFGFFAFSGKITAFIGPFLVSTLTDVFKNQRIGMSSVFVLFLVGGILLARVKEAAGVRAAEEAS